MDSKREQNEPNIEIVMDKVSTEVQDVEHLGNILNTRILRVSYIHGANNSQGYHLHVH